MRIVTLVLVVLAAAALAASAMLAIQAQRFARESVVAPGVVTALLAGPLHAEVTVTPDGRPSFSYVENAAGAPLRVGQPVAVRFLAHDPRGTARVAAANSYRTSLEVAAMALALLLMAALSPWLVARFPGLLAYPVRP